MYIKDLIKELKKHKPKTLVRVRLDDSFWKQDGFLDSKGKEIKIPKEIKEGIEHNLIIPNYWVSEVEDSSYQGTTENSEYPELTLWGEY